MGSKQRLTILNQLKEDMAKIQVTNDYHKDVSRIERSYWDKGDVHEYPFICFHCDSDNVLVDTFGDDMGRRILNIRVFGYIPVEPPDFDDVHLLAEDIETFLESTDNTCDDDVEVGDVEIYEGTELDKIGFFLMHITISYER